MKKTLVVLLFFVCSIKAQEAFILLTSIHGEKQGDAYSSVAQLGDVNGDGYNDFIVGSRGKGYAKLYFGGSPFDTLDCVRFQSHEQFTAYSGSFAGDGDLNGDGYKDFVLGAAYDIFQFGKIFIHYGKSKIDTLADKTITGKGPYYHFGVQMTMSGDLNGDGYDDLVVSAPSDDIDAHGRVYIYFGGKEMDTICDVLLEGKSPFDTFGGSIAIVGDTNGDGYDDLLVGASQSLAKNKTGEAYLFYGGKSIGFSNSREFVGKDSLNGSYGNRVAGLGDINGDGFSDFGITSSTTVDIFSGAQLTNFYTISSTKKYWYPLYLSNGVDINNDGFSDFAMSYAYQENQYTGDVAIYLGKKSINSDPSIIINGITKNGYLGTGLAISNDINGDSFAEVFVGENGELTQNGTIGYGKTSLYTYGTVDALDNSQYSVDFPEDYKLFDNYPNPFNPETTINYQISSSCNVNITIFDLLGCKIATLIDEVKAPGNYKVKFNVDNLEKSIVVPSGIYFYTLKAGNYFQVKKMLLTK
ncbi:MAG: hypothetical protein A2499_00815 [Stygiobacter sp. RIFOXYC12_FULL_38_8]|nr:MAG: hypothetical protein A2X62_13235 [Stygiobacter sp. GWC2_38_9]OGU83238.1 MAG: hypothetical protein A2279_05375 [Stygiobacter sp. RIFOXYA12_FULL_38_9]OGV06095.1 MAG: hypothetical protein A2299_07780 [Stygiobacter sp. RIFOXYB2_FULL_37_11]OGV16840.1 MAG: hypothetical protein A2440_05735 [Stygiobacter sp. RIFOXYC2_FULL_38_25]OGV17330.1 MAG: hypothetical protein A2237_14445 [Stygiobacter sp. RIFOXYA2_FULL_38_8]OGV23448.1 MAG: hypothetical protein A2499_00815 [Stygiobacter sp. RIFOXYC12_FULL_